jgi:phosphoglycerol transferase
MLVLASVLDLRPAARSLPYAYQGDTMFYHLIAKALTEGGWFLDVPELGAPGGLNLRDVPTSDNNLHVLVMWALAQGTSHYPSVLNGFFLLTFPLVFLASLVVLRHFGVGWPAGVSASLLYTFAPFHFARGEHHLFLAAYWPIPLAVLVALWVIRGELVPPAPAGRDWRSRRVFVSLLVCLALSATGFYYAFFTCFFLIVAGIAAAVRQRSWARLWPAVALVAVIGGGLVVNLLPSLVHFADTGTPSVVRRHAGDADEFGLRIAQMLMPVTGHRLFDLDRLKERYNRRAFVNENDHASLGVVGSIGFLGLVCVFFSSRWSGRFAETDGGSGLLRQLGTFTVAGVLFGTIGGLGSLLAFFGIPQVRAYNRISLFLAFFALFAAALWTDRWLGRQSGSRRREGAAFAVLVLATALALGDQIAPRMLPDYRVIASEFGRDEAFVRKIETQLPRGAQILQLPHMPFPEGVPRVRMQDYDLLRGYLHSTHLRWSYGTIRGQIGNAWLRQLAARPIAEVVDTLVWTDFDGLYIDRRGFQDNGAEIAERLEALLPGAATHSDDGQLIFYDLRSHRARVKQQTPTTEWASRRDLALHPVLALWSSTFYDEEGEPGHSWRWAGAQGRLELFNGSARARRVKLRMKLVGNDGGHVRIETALRSALEAPIKPHGADVEEILTVPPGRHSLHFSADARPVLPPGDYRDLVFAIHEFTITPLAH